MGEKGRAQRNIQVDSGVVGEGAREQTEAVISFSRRKVLPKAAEPWPCSRLAGCGCSCACVP